VVLHPQSIIHSMVVCRDASVMAQLGTPDMRVPIAVGLAHPERIESGADRLDFLKLGPLNFEEADPVRFPGLPLAFDALRAPEGSTTVLNAANEIGVQAFLDRRIRFTDIHRVNSTTIDRVRPEAGDALSLPALLELDERARRAATDLVKEVSR
jgi:1-deoxy-D-xylulose-5-phosphate reductoisomerase